MDKKNKHIDAVGLLPKVFSGEASPEEDKLINEWLVADPANRTKYNAFARLWNLTAATTTSDDIDIENEWQRMDKAIEPVYTRTFRLTRLLQIAASVVIISTLAYIGIKTSSIQSIKAPVTELSSVQLPDGTLVSLNAGSKISYRKDFGSSHRDLNLIGEAYFEVKKGAVPFIITAGEACIRVTGTKFNVKAYTGKPEIKVTVTEGTVRFYQTEDPHIEVTITAGETGMYDKSVQTVKRITSVNLNDLSWKTGILDFHNTPLSEVTDVLTNTYHMPITVNPALQNCTITVRFENQEPDSVFNVLKSTLDLTINKKGKRYIITGDGC